MVFTASLLMEMHYSELRVNDRQLSLQKSDITPKNVWYSTTLLQIHLLNRTFLWKYLEMYSVLSQNKT